jgi:hypothetical protein
MPEGTERELGPVELAIAGELPNKAKGKGLATIALLLAQRLDDGVEVFYDEGIPRIVQTSAQSTTALARELRMCMGKIHETYAVGEPQGPVASLAERRARRRGAR